MPATTGKTSTKTQFVCSQGDLLTVEQLEPGAAWAWCHRADGMAGWVPVSYMHDAAEEC
jgi:hypothetical protein